MDFNVIIVSAIIIALCVLPMLVLNSKQKKKKAGFKTMLTQIAKTKSGEIKAFDISAPIAVGITENDEAFVFYHKHESGDEEKVCILLNDVKQCHVVQTNRGSNSGLIGKILMTFEYYDKSKPDFSLVFYNSEESFQLTGELQLVEKWKPILKAAIASHSASRKAVPTPKLKMAMA